MKSPNPVRKILLYILFVSGFSLLQFFWPAAWTAWGIKPDFQLVLVAACGFLYDFRDGLVTGLCCGLIRDCLSARYMGLGLLMLFICGVLSSRILKKRFSQNLITVFLLVTLLTFGSDLVIFLIQLAAARAGDAAHWPIQFWGVILKRFIPQILFNLVSAIPVFVLLRHFGPYPRRFQDSLAQSAERSLS